MIKNHLTIAFRSFFNGKGYSFINVTGLALGMACAVLIFLVVRHETSYDLSQSRLDRIYRVETENIKENHIYPELTPAWLTRCAQTCPKPKSSHRSCKWAGGR